MENNNGKRDLHKLYNPPPPEDYSKNYIRLVIVIFIAGIFIALEIIGGTIAKSIAIISDAIHLISDLLGFIFSFIFLYLSKKEMDQKVSFGYHRMELIGALANIFIVWTMVLFIIYEATLRIINKEFVAKPAIMLITAIAGLLINVILYKILHGGSSHSHGLMADSHDHSHSDFQQQQNSVCEPECQDQACQKTISQSHCHKGKDRNVHRHSTGKNVAQQYCELKHEHSNTCYLKSEKKQHKHVCEGHHHDHKHSHENHNHQNGHNHDEFQHPHHNHAHHNHNHPHDSKQHNHDDHKHQEEHHDHDHSSHESIGMQSAVLHALSDLVQSVGVVLSALVIYFYGSEHGAEVYEWNPYHLFDPIATYIFSILSLIATFPVIRNCYYLIMESTPSHINLDALREQFEAIDGVIDVHDIHVWDLKPGKTIMIAHVLAKKDSERAVLTQLTDLCREKRIYHSTFQVEEQELKDDKDYILCRHDIH